MEYFVKKSPHFDIKMKQEEWVSEWGSLLYRRFEQDFSNVTTCLLDVEIYDRWYGTDKPRIVIRLNLGFEPDGVIIGMAS